MGVSVCSVLLIGVTDIESAELYVRILVAYAPLQ